MPSDGQRRCPNCGCFCGVVYRSAGGAGQVERPSCVSCGLNPPHCSQETGTVYGCQTDATHYGAPDGSNHERPWCPEHAPDDADPYPYAEGSA